MHVVHLLSEWRFWDKPGGTVRSPHRPKDPPQLFCREQTRPDSPASGRIYSRCRRFPPPQKAGFYLGIQSAGPPGNDQGNLRSGQLFFQYFPAMLQIKRIHNLNPLDPDAFRQLGNVHLRGRIPLISLPVPGLSWWPVMAVMLCPKQ